MGSKNGKNAKNRNRKLIFQPEVPKKAYFRFRFLIFKASPYYFGKKLVEFDLFWPISLEFQPEVVLFPPEVGLNQLIFQNFQGFTRFVAKSW